MSSHLMGEAADFSTYLTGSTKRLGPFHVTGISSVQLLAASNGKPSIVEERLYSFFFAFKK